MNRRGFMRGLAGIFVAGYAPAVFSYFKARSWRVLDGALTGVQLPASTTAREIIVSNKGATPLRVYPCGFVPSDQYGNKDANIYEIGSYEVITFYPPAP